MVASLWGRSAFTATPRVLRNPLGLKIGRHAAATTKGLPGGQRCWTGRCQLRRRCEDLEPLCPGAYHPERVITPVRVASEDDHTLGGVMRRTPRPRPPWGCAPWVD